MNEKEKLCIRVVLADDHVVVRNGVRAVIERRAEDIRIVAEVSTGIEVLELPEQLLPDIYVMDISMPELNGIEVTDRLVKKNSKNKIIILSMHDNVEFVERALRAGARGYIVKQSATEELIHAIREVYKGRMYLSSQVAKYVVDGFLSRKRKKSTKTEIVKLTRKEREVLQLTAEGGSQKNVAIKLNVSVNTVHVHTTNIMKKLDLHNKADLVRFALREGVVHPQF